MKKILLITLVAAMLLLTIACGAGGGASSPAATGSAAAAMASLDPVASGPASSLAPVEVKEYKGKNLSDLSKLQDNAIAGTQHIDVNTYKLAVTGLVNTPQELTYNDVLSLPHYQKAVTLNCVEGWSADILWEGVLIKDIIAKAGAQSGANTVIFYGSDEYTTSLPLDYITNKNILLAYKMNGLVIPAEKGFPFMVVAEDKLGYKWAKWIVKIELSNDPSYKGYWESRGYGNDADITPAASAG